MLLGVFVTYVLERSAHGITVEIRPPPKQLPSAAASVTVGAHEQALLHHDGH
jgi:hypothetical protein